ncbi:PaaX family transcriptional regulator [Microbacterium sp. YY-01]|uniref:PaaX family transcriptional regulator n=1 Tax=Microbacterium sp. YY-01 TaxID=3421634 RepID=UPI003D173FE8
MTTPALDDIDARAGSTTSLLRTITGLFVRQHGGTITAAAFITLTHQLGIDAARTRTGLARLKSKQLLLSSPTGRGYYQLNPLAHRMLEHGDRRIFHPRSMSRTDPWCLISYSLPENQRHTRHQLRTRLHYLGAGILAPGLWICPGHLAEEVEEITVHLGVRHATTLIRAHDPQPGIPLPTAAARWWDLDRIRSHHDLFLREYTPHHSTLTNPDAAPPKAALFARYVRLIDTWRVIAYIDPGLPPHLLPADWPAPRSTRLFRQLHERWHTTAHNYAASIIAP